MVDESSKLVKFCKDCANFIPKGKKCGASPRPINLVDGSDDGFFYAESERQTFGKCGPEAKLWVANHKAAA